ncbi:hypothetical protein M422DRAFT_35793 [Sphaerobolus stellatus SS14]|uniref:Peptidase A1 domain-containing protein n=1 Tax=Sphaerobolus stellatus (strain SS14) TaxID=990650 RepID=A0A0C9UCS1_SPHS4|nr:hypothetical protein M422DRAFT_35793 [Sphaerobolus stellatus SS14]
MHFTSTCIILAITVFNGLLAGAAPINRQKGILTFPIRSLHRRSGDLSDPLYFKRTINRAYHRAGKLTGRQNGASVVGRDYPMGPRDTETHAASRIMRKRALQVANAPDAPNSLGLDIDGSDSGYIATIQIGTPPRDFNILMDSGSSDLWVGSEICSGQKGGNCGQHTFLGLNSSSTFVNTTDAWNITYGTGFAAGFKVQDNIAIAGMSLNNHTFGIAQVESSDFTGADFDGLMGLAQSGLSNQGVPTPVESLALQGLISEAIVSYKISRGADKLNDGEISFGGLDSSKFDSSTLTTLPNLSPIGFWEAAMDGASVDGKDAGFNNRTAILDTGTSLAFGPRNDVIALHKLITGAAFDGQTFTVPCSLNQSVALSFGGRTFTIDPRDIAFAQANNNDVCVSGIQTGAVDDNGSTWLVGDTFLKNAYYSTDVNRNTISLAKLI